jgi:5-methylcytosine-specific restriction protein A
MRVVRRPILASQERSGWGKYMREHPERAEFYASAAWRGARKRHLREHPHCMVCAQPANIVDHILSRAEGGADLDPANLQSLCRSCHGRKTQAESHRGRKRAAQQPKEER